MGKRKLEEYKGGEEDQGHGVSYINPYYSLQDRDEGLTAPMVSNQGVHDSSGTPYQSKAKTKLIAVLEKVLESSVEDIDDATRSKCLKLRQSLDSLNNTPLKPAEVNPYLSQRVQRPPLAPGTLSNLSPWTSTSIPPLGFPPALPPIKNSLMEKSAFTHQGTHESFSYERLEWLGDAYIYLISTHLIYHTFPSHTPGRMAQLRERLVKNETLAGYARNYDFHKRAKLPSDLKSLTKVHGDIFEAYAGAVILADSENGFENVAEWMKSLWAGTIAPDIIAEERRSAGNALTSLTSLSTTSSAQPMKVVNLAELPPKDRLLALIGSKGIKIYYKESAPVKTDRNSKLPLYSMACYLDDSDDGTVGKQLGWGSALSKKNAGHNAAEMAMTNEKIMKKYGKRKIRVDEEVRRQRGELESLKASQDAAI